MTDTIKCPLCTISSNEALLYEDDSIYLVPTKDLKGHKVRIMAVTKCHTTQPTFKERTLAYSVLIDYMTNLMRRQDWYIVDSTYASTPEHWHVLACDTPSEDELDPLFAKTPKIHFPLKEERVLIGIPAYNEEKALPTVLAEAKKHGNVIVIDDNSIDKTKLVAQQANVEVLTHTDRFGYGFSISNLFQIAKIGNYDALVTLDADGQHDPSEIPRFLKELKITDIVTGNRFLGENNIPSYRKFGIKAISKLGRLGDAQCGFRAYNKKAIVAITSRIYEKGMGASIEILKIAQSNNLKITEIPCTIQYGEEDHSQNPLSHGLDVIRAFFWAIIWDKPSKTLLPLGVFFLIATLISGIQTINLYIINRSTMISWSWVLLTIISLVCTFSIFNVLTFIFVFKNKKMGQQ
jgi:glycosyltransferase involved in cell wall biosynthesis